MSLEAWLRRIVWLFRERPRFAWSLVAMALTGSIALVRLRLGNRSGIRLLKTSNSGRVTTNAALKDVIDNAYERAKVAKALVPLHTDESVVVEDRGIPVSGRCWRARQA